MTEMRHWFWAESVGCDWFWSMDEMQRTRTIRLSLETFFDKISERWQTTWIACILARGFAALMLAGCCFYGFGSPPWGLISFDRADKCVSRIQVFVFRTFVYARSYSYF